MYYLRLQEISSIPLKISSFKKYFKKEYNIGIHVPRKDKCSLCARFENIPESERTEKNRADFIKHQNDKDIAKQVFLVEQIRSSKDEFIVVSFDLQKVLATTHGTRMLFGFSRKYAVYNFTVYESKSQNGFCYIWGEKDGKRGVNKICSNLYQYLVKVDDEGQFKSVSFFCDNCPRQNKNKIMVSMMFHFLNHCKNVEELTITYLVAGLTYMPVDSVHAVIENYSKSMNVPAPSEWSTIIRNARCRPKLYEIVQVYYPGILDWKSLSVPRKLQSVDGLDIKTNDVTRIKFKKEHLNKCFVLRIIILIFPMKLNGLTKDMRTFLRCLTESYV
ncbi:hypothetical protein ILUMI_17577 [Ignelater luminosus]|uniref:DUF7869 domain-containing protein n=1 Tax=Ignelater luminosus TaxID=2038154 RepID=A0A8K0CP70_IGNLU|nr:hypothetical protein ILUMI_17577 [Ignelater luminosus]